MLSENTARQLLAKRIRSSNFHLVSKKKEEWIIESSSKYYVYHFVSKLDRAISLDRHIRITVADTELKLLHRQIVVDGQVFLCVEPIASLFKQKIFSLPNNVAFIAGWGISNNNLLSNIATDEFRKVVDLAKVSPSVKTTQQKPIIANPVISEPLVASITKSEEQTPFVRSLRKGMRIDAYKLEQRLGRGFSAEVWKAEIVSNIPGVQLSKGSTLAVKFYRLPLLQGAEALRIQREFAIASEVDHPNFARVYDLVISPSRPFHTFMAMEYVDGVTLKEYISDTTQISIKQILDIGIQLFAALDELHSFQAIHRDVKPANVILTNSSQENINIKLVDLGIVSVINEPAFTATSAFLGSKHSAPLEQLTGEPLDKRADIYGAGGVLFSCYKGVPMYDNVGPEGAIVRKMLIEPETLEKRSKEDNLSEQQLVSFINKCIAANKQERPKSAKECLEKLRNIRAESKES